ncbi:MAG: 1-deoxy-D-xylulose-5-phosphate reductoisomerase [Caldiserica bacterium]|nr:1-deoxy-D-xylulose-5-phosphate reductoisomerase [Caldisericota bacterium]MDH7562087.1 1-deoxy-D-xylulose-5-phosphate reductoisomerase [Caldisericota bacterium]
MKRIAILGATGSIGKQALEVFSRFPEELELVGVSACRSVQELKEIVERFRPKAVACGDENSGKIFEGSHRSFDLYFGEEGLVNLATREDVDLVLVALVGISGLLPTLEALKAGKTVALATKEALVAGGKLIREVLSGFGGEGQTRNTGKSRGTVDDFPEGDLGEIQGGRAGGMKEGLKMGPLEGNLKEESKGAPEKSLREQEGLEEGESGFVSPGDLKAGLEGEVPEGELGSVSRGDFKAETEGEAPNDFSEYHGGRLIPVDSEHSAIFQCLEGKRREEIRRIILTASGGPFLGRSTADLEGVTPEEAISHPIWRMGPKISVDSATMMNKALEIIEAHFLFDLPPEQISVLIHPQSIVHGMVEFRDGSVQALLSLPDMRLPIQYALLYPRRMPSLVRPLSLEEVGRLEFERSDFERFPALKLAYKALEMGGTAPAVLSAADEVAVGLFLEGKIPFTRIVPLVEEVLSRHGPQSGGTLEEVLGADLWARKTAKKLGTVPTF